MRMVMIVDYSYGVECGVFRSILYWVLSGRKNVGMAATPYWTGIAVLIAACFVLGSAYVSLLRCVPP